MARKAEAMKARICVRSAMAPDRVGVRVGVGVRARVTCVRSAMAPETMVVAVAAKTNWNDLVGVSVRGGVRARVRARVSVTVTVTVTLTVTLMLETMPLPYPYP